MGVTNPGGLYHAGASHSPVSFFTMSISCTRDKISIKICSHLRMLLCSVTKSRSSPMNPPMPPPGLPVLQRRNGRRLFRPLMRASATYIPWYLFQPCALKHNQPSKPAQAHSPAEIRSSRTSLLPRQPPTYLFPCHTQHGTIRHVSLRVRPGFQHFGIVSSWVCFFVSSCPE